MDHLNEKELYEVIRKIIFVSSSLQSTGVLCSQATHISDEVSYGIGELLQHLAKELSTLKDILENDCNRSKCK